MLLGLWRYIRPYQGLFWLSMLLLPAISACMLVEPWIVNT
jgi:hypothetical protein